MTTSLCIEWNRIRRFDHREKEFEKKKNKNYSIKIKNFLRNAGNRLRNFKTLLKKLNENYLLFYGQFYTENLC